MLDNAIKYSHGVYQLALHRRAMLHRFYNNRPDLAFRDYRTTYLHLPSAYHLLAEVSPVYLLGHVSDSEPQIFLITITLWFRLLVISRPLNVAYWPRKLNTCLGCFKSVSLRPRPSYGRSLRQRNSTRLVTIIY